MKESPCQKLLNLLEMRSVTVHYTDDKGKEGSYDTSVNGSDDSIKHYFMVGSKLNIGDGGNDKMVTIKKVDLH